jgi:hypothetical protein
MTLETSHNDPYLAVNDGRKPNFFLWYDTSLDAVDGGHPNGKETCFKELAFPTKLVPVLADINERQVDKPL